MFSTYSIRIFSNLISQRSLRSIPKTVTNYRTTKNNKTANLLWFSRTITSKVLTNSKFSQEENIRKIVKLIKEYPNPESINWEELEKQLELEPRTVILQACLRMKDLNAGINYFNYVSNKGKDLTPVELIFVLKLFETDKNNIIKYESLIKQIYDKIKVYMSSEVIQKYLSSMITEIPDYFYDLTKNICEDKKYPSGVRHLVIKSLELKNPKSAFEMMSAFQVNINSVFTNYLNYLCQMVLENKFSVDMINNLVKYCEEHNNIIGSKNYELFLNNFFNTLKQYDKNFEWSLSDCVISNSNICSNCGKKLIDKCISESEFDSLKKAFLPKAGLTEKNVFLSSSEAELERFFKFLKDSNPYQMVVDGLNLIYRDKRTSGFLSRPIKYFLDKNLNVLIIGRKHAKNELLRMSFLKKKYYKDRCQFFFADNMSDDDVFTLYATLHGGLGTYFISGDYLQRYGARFDDKLKRIYFKWKAYHQFVYITDIMPPLPSLGLSQLTSVENGENFTWHISHIGENFMSNLLTPSESLSWACLQAKKKSS